MRVFPTRLFYFDGIEADIERRTLSGGTSIAGEEDIIETDGGGRVYAVFTDPDLADPEEANAWRAISTGFGAGEAIIVPLGDARHQMFGDVTTPPDGLPTWDESDFEAGQTDCSAAGAATLGATTLTLDSSGLNGPVRFGIWFSIDHPTWRHRAYRIAEVNGDTVKFRPPLREAVEADTLVEIRDPKCTMRIEGSMASPTSMGFAFSPQVRFVEFPGAVA